jgi:hypothetical protein
MKRSILYFHIVKPLGKHICMLHVDEHDVQNASERLSLALTKCYAQQTTVKTLELVKAGENDYALNVMYTIDGGKIEYKNVFEQTELY